MRLETNASHPIASDRHSVPPKEMSGLLKTIIAVIDLVPVRKRRPALSHPAFACTGALGWMELRMRTSMRQMGTTRVGIHSHRNPAMYLRFVIADIHEDSGRELGIFHAARNLWEEGDLYPYEEERYNSIRAWFNDNLQKPTRFTASKPPYYRKKNKAISWFKDSAAEHIKHIRELVIILGHHGVAVRMVKANRVGYIVYEDKYQIVAEPFADTKR
jgi:hypothetical protein